ncbi:anti-phage ZorAB system protein ZorA [Polycladidibacter stylochi]|uniref:anti-phage ZorAB system protein ZorA n=1 Tax=Polycladidibacter stylochi TaxID=1807766 RepID=UPI000AED54CB|nr:anti-phage ZorAB system protein ZorA [Pseudovibrio stylochi]
MYLLGRIIWNGWVRFLIFWVIVAAVLYGFDNTFKDINYSQLLERMSLAIKLAANQLNALEAKVALFQLSETKFILSLAYGIAVVAISFAISFFILHVLIIKLSVYLVKRKINKFDRPEDFKRAYENQIDPVLRSHRLIGNVWREFDETLVHPREGERQVIRNTVRPHTFLNMGLVRDKLAGIKMMPSIPGYFVAVGLLLTFAGIVLALYKAGAASSANDVTKMQEAMTELLQIASFKFATSIAGLGCSLLLSIVFKMYMIWIESDFSSLCETIEKKLLYVAPQALAVQMNSIMEEQRDQLKDIGSEQFFNQMGQSLAPQIHSAFTHAMAPVNQSISNALEKVTESSQTGITEMLQKFSHDVQSSAGTELRELAVSLTAMQQTLSDMQAGMKTSGEDFAQCLSKAAENLNQLVGEAAKSMNDGAASSRDSLHEIVSALQATFEKANLAIEQDLTKAATGASDKIERAMGRVLENLEGQITQLSSGMSQLEGNLAGSVQQTQQSMELAQKNAIETVNSVAVNTANALKNGLTETLQTLRSEIDRFEKALGSSSVALGSQATAIGDATSQTKQVSDVIGQTASTLRQTITPFTQSVSKIENATLDFKQSLSKAVVALGESQSGSNELAATLKDEGQKLTRMWQDYEVRFQRIDTELGNAVESLASATSQQGATLTKYSSEVDKSLAQAVRHLNSNVTDIADSVEEFADEVGKLHSVLRPAAE